MKVPKTLAFALAVSFPALLAADELAADKIGFMSAREDEIKLRPDGITLIWSQGRDGSISRKQPAFQENSTTPTTAFCRAISSAQAGKADRSRPCDTIQEAIAEAYAKVACKVAEDPKKEYSSGVEYDPRSEKFYPIEPITGNDGKEVKLPSGKGIKETMHYHPNGTKFPSSADLWSADVPGIVLVGDKRGGVSPEILCYDENGNYSIMEMTEEGRSFKELSWGRLSELCSDRERASWDRLIAELAAQSDWKGQKNVLEESISSNWQKGNLPACPDKTYDRNAIVRQSERNEIGAVVDYSARTSAPAYQTQTIDYDYRAAKAQASAMLEGVYQQGYGIAAESGAGAEYQAAVAPVMSRGRAAISAIPDQETFQVPVSTPRP